MPKLSSFLAKRRALRRGTVAPDETEEDTAQAAGSRTFRLFVSSTFRDMEAERNILQKVAFPRLREFCGQHGARFQAIDLRWGVSEEAAVDQQAMNICLGEIGRCNQVTPRPNFLVLLGDRYGWRPPPPQIPAEEFERILERVGDSSKRAVLQHWYWRDENANPAEYLLQPRTGSREAYRDPGTWNPVENRIREILSAVVEGETDLALDEHRRRTYLASATEQEVFAGALAITNPDGKAFAFFRSILGYPTDDQGNPRGKAGRYVSSDPEVRARLVALKTHLEEELPASTIKASQVGWGGDGPRLEEAYLLGLADWVVESLEGVIREELTRPPQLPDLGEAGVLKADARLAGEAVEHLEFAQERCRFFVGRGDSLKAIRDYLRSRDPQPFAVWGEGGCGKSALLAEASRAARDEHIGSVVIARFVGATPGSSLGRHLLDGLCREISMRYGVNVVDPSMDYQELVQELHRRVRLASNDRPLILFLDSLDQLEEPARGLAWIPEPLPENVRVVVSTRSGDVQESLKRRQAMLWELGAMSRDEGSHLLDDWLHATRRRLQPGQRDEVLSNFEASNGNPLYLKFAFEEARCWHAFRQKPEEASPDEPGPPLAPDLRGIIQDNLFQRLAEKDNQGLRIVSHGLGYLAASRHGLAEDELFDLLSRDPDVYAWFVRTAQHMPQDLVDQARNHWQERRRAGRGDGMGKPVRRSAVKRWLQFLRRDPQRLKGFLAKQVDLTALRLPVVLWSRLSFDLQPYLTLRRAEGGDLLAFYHRELADAAREQFLTDEPKNILRERTAEYFADRPVSRKIEEYPYQLLRSKQWAGLARALCDPELFCYAMEHQRGYEWIGYWEPARHRFDPVNRYELAIEAKWREEGECPEVALLLDHASRLFELMGSYESALTFREREFEILKGILGDEDPALAPHIDNLASLHYRLGEHGKAEELNRLAMAMHKKMTEPNPFGEAVFLSNRAMTLKSLGRSQEAIPLAERALGIAESMKGPTHPDIVPILLSLSPLYGDIGDIENATRLCARALLIEEQAKGSDHPDVAEVLNNLAHCQMQSERYSEALSNFERALLILERKVGGAHPNTAGVLSNMGSCHQFMGQHERSMEFLDRALTIDRQRLGESHPSVAYVLFRMSYNLVMLGDFEEARKRCERAVEIAREALGEEDPQTLGYLERLEAIEGVSG